MRKISVTIFLLFIFGYNFCQTKKLLIIGIDGCRADVITKQFAPTMDSIILLSNTAYTYHMKNEKRTMSAPNWTSMLTGVHCNKHRAMTNTFAGNKIAKHPHFFKYLEENNKKIATASYPHWMQINKFIVNRNADYAPYSKKEPTDESVKDKAIQWLSNSDIADAMFIHFDDVDHNGHSTGFSPLNKNYTDAVSRIDKYINEIFKKIHERIEKYKEDWLVMISTDHGGRKSKRGGHGMGMFNKDIRNVFWIINGNATQPGEMKNAHTIDVAATALQFFDIPLKKEWKIQGKSMGLKSIAVSLGK